MIYKETEKFGFPCVEFHFDGNPARVIKPLCLPNGKWALKAEYADAFPEAEIELLKRGWHIAYNKNDNRWAELRDVERKAKFVKFVSKEFSLNSRCVTVGMSCGGLYSVMLAAKYPELIEGLYLDAPVMNLLSCPFGLGTANNLLAEEFIACTGKTASQMLSYRNHPIDNMHILLQNDIPVLLVAGDSDVTVPYRENGALLEQYYKENGGRIEVVVKVGCDHHPHGLDNASELADKIENLRRLENVAPI